MKKIINEYSIELDKIFKNYESDLDEKEKEEVVKYITALESNLHFFKKIMKDKKQLKSMIKHISSLGEE